MSKGERTKERILDRAEALFAEGGYEAVSMRDVADSLNISPGLLTYHFPTKRDLFASVITRRSEAFRTRREQALEELGADAGIEEVMRAFVRPLVILATTEGAGWHAYTRLLARLHVTATRQHDPDLRELNSGRLLIGLLRERLPGLSEERAARAYIHVTSVILGVFASTGALDRLSDGTLASGELESAIEPMIAFLTGGVTRLAALESAEREPARRGRQSSRQKANHSQAAPETAPAAAPVAKAGRAAARSNGKRDRQA